MPVDTFENRADPDQAALVRAVQSGSTLFDCGDMINTHYHNRNLIWRTVSRRVDEIKPSDHPRRVASSVIQWFGLIHETGYCTPDQVTIMIICLLYALF